MKRLGRVQFWRGPLRGCVLGVLVNPHAAWIGWHYSRWNRRVCVNLLPCCTIWFCLEGGIEA